MSSSEIDRFKEKHSNRTKILVYLKAYFCGGFIASIIIALFSIKELSKTSLQNILVMPFMFLLVATMMGAPGIIAGLVVYLLKKEYSRSSWIKWIGGMLFLLNVIPVIFLKITDGTNSGDSHFVLWLLFINLYALLTISFLWYFHNKVFGKTVMDKK